MKTASMRISFLLIFSFIANGCVVLALGAGAAGGYAISKDEMEGFSSQKYDHIWNVSEQVLQEEGSIEIRDKQAGRIEAFVKGSKVKFELEQISPESTRIRVQARKAMNMFPDMS